jgi:hypothetical protein
VRSTETKTPAITQQPSKNAQYLVFQNPQFQAPQSRLVLLPEINGAAAQQSQANTAALALVSLGGVGLVIGGAILAYKTYKWCTAEAPEVKAEKEYQNYWREAATSSCRYRE